MSRENAKKRGRVPLKVGEKREDPDPRYRQHAGREGKMRVVEVTFLGADGKASVVDTASKRPSKISIATLERWRVVT